MLRRAVVPPRTLLNESTLTKFPSPARDFSNFFEENGKALEYERFPSFRSFPNHTMAEHFLSIEVKKSPKSPALDHTGEPMDVIGPHFVKRNPVDRHPERICLRGLRGSSNAVGRDKNRALKAVAVGELKMQEAPLFDSRRSDKKLLLRLANCGLDGRFAGLDASAGTVDFPGTESAFFSDEEDLSVPNNKTESRTFARLPVVPEIIHRADASRRRRPGRREIFVATPRTGEARFDGVRF